MTLLDRFQRDLSNKSGASGSTAPLLYGVFSLLDKLIAEIFMSNEICHFVILSYF